MTQPAPDPGAAREPLASPAFITGAVGAVLYLLVAFNVHLSSDQQRAIGGVSLFVVPLVVWAWGRRKTFSPHTVSKMVAQAQVGLPVNPADPPAGGTDKKSGV